MSDQDGMNEAPLPGNDPALPTTERPYFEVADDGDEVYRAPGFKWVNKYDIKLSKDLGIGRGPYEDQRGLPKFSAPPRIAFENKKRRPLDFYLFDRVWLVSDRFKALLEAFDPGGFEFLQTESYLRDAPLDRPHWFCDAIRVLDCLDEGNSDLRYWDSPWRTVRGVIQLTVRPEAVGSAHAFQLKLYKDRVIVDSAFVDLVVKHHVTGFNFVTLDGTLHVINGSGKRIR